MKELRAFHSKYKEIQGIYLKTNLYINSSKLKPSSFSRTIFTSYSNQIFCATKVYGVVS